MKPFFSIFSFLRFFFFFLYFTVTTTFDFPVRICWRFHLTDQQSDLFDWNDCIWQLSSQSTNHQSMLHLSQLVQLMGINGPKKMAPPLNEKMNSGLNDDWGNGVERKRRVIMVENWALKQQQRRVNKNRQLCRTMQQGQQKQEPTSNSWVWICKNFQIDDIR